MRAFWRRVAQAAGRNPMADRALPWVRGHDQEMSQVALLRQLVRDHTGARHRRFWLFKLKGRKTQPRAMEQPDPEFWSRRRRSN